MKPKDRSKKKKSLGFVGRIKYIKDFKDQLDDLPNAEYSILSFYGEGGIGKTELMQHLYQTSIKQVDTFSFFHDFEKDHATSRDFFSHLYAHLNKELNSVRFTLAFAIYWSKINENIALGKKSRKFSEETSFIGDVLEKLDSVEYTDLLGPGLGLLVKYGKDKVLEKYLRKTIGSDVYEEILNLETCDISNFPSELAYFLAEDIKSYREKHPQTNIIFFFDTYEEVYSRSDLSRIEQEHWVSEFIREFYKLQVMFVVTGRDKFILKNCNPHIKEYSVTGLSDEDGRTILQDTINDNNIIEMIISKFDGLPFYLTLAIELYAELKDSKILTAQDFDIDTPNDIINRFLKGIDREIKSLIEILSIPRFFDEDLVEYILEKYSYNISLDDRERIYEYSFFKIKREKGKSTYYMHSLMRDGINNKISNNNSMKYHGNQNLAYYYKDKVDNNNEYFIDEDIGFLSEFIYHSLKVDDIDFENLSTWLDPTINKFKESGKSRQLIPILTDYIYRCNNDFYKHKSMIELGLLYSSLKVSSLDKIIEDLNDENLSIEHMRGLYLLEAKYYENNANKSRIKGKKRDLLEKAQNKYLLLDQVLDLSSKIDISIGRSNVLRKLSQTENRNKKKSLLNKAKNILIDVESIVNKNKEFEDRRGTLYYKLGLIYKNLNNDRYNPIDMFFRSIKIQKKYLKPDHLDIAKNYEQIGIISKDYKYLLKALEICLEYYALKSSKIQGIYIELSKIFSGDPFCDIYLENVDEFVDKETLILYLYKMQLKENINNKYLNMYLSYAIDDETKISSYFSLFSLLNLHKKNMESIKYLYKIVFIYKKNKDFKNLAKVYSLIAKYYDDNNYKDICVEKYYQKSIKLLIKSANHKLLAKTYGSLANFKSNKGINGAEEYFLMQIDISKKYNLEELESAYAYLSSYYTRQNDTERGINYLLLRIDLIKEKNDIGYLDKTYQQLNKLVNNNYKYNNVDEREYYLKEALEYYKVIGANRYIDKMYGKLMDYYNIDKKPSKEISKKIESLYFKQINVRKSSGNIMKYAKGYSYLSKFYIDNYWEKDYNKADEYLKKSIEVSEKVTFYAKENVDLYSIVASIYAIYLRNSTQATVNYLKAIKIAKELKDNNLIFQQYEYMIKHYYQLDKCKLVYKYIAKQEEIGISSGQKRILLDAYNSYALFYKKMNNAPKSAKYLKKAYIGYKNLDYIDMQCKCLMNLGDLYELKYNASIKYYKKMYLLAILEHPDGQMYINYAYKKLPKSIIIQLLECQVNKIINDTDFDFIKFRKLIIEFHVAEKDTLMQTLSRVWPSFLETYSGNTFFSTRTEFKKYPELQEIFKNYETKSQTIN